MNTITEQFSSEEKEILISALKSYSWAVSGAERNYLVESVIEKIEQVA